MTPKAVVLNNFTVFVFRTVLAPFRCLISFLRSIPHVRCLRGRGMAARWTWNRCFRQTPRVADIHRKQRFSSAKFFRGGCSLRETTQPVCFSSSELIGGTFLVWLSVSIALRWTPESMEKPHRPFESVHHAAEDTRSPLTFSLARLQRVALCFFFLTGLIAS